MTVASLGSAGRLRVAWVCATTTMWLSALTSRLRLVTHRAPGPTPSATLFDRLQEVLRLAEACPSGPSGDALRRAACELVEAESSSARMACRRRMLRCVNGAQERSRSRVDDPNALLLRQLADALRRERWAG